jgi:branched-subunit amino acid ABC-type transport system permease component
VKHQLSATVIFQGTFRCIMQELQVILSGVAQGCIYGLIALGFVLIYKATETVSFAQGELMMLGAFCGLGQVHWGLMTPVIWLKPVNQFCNSLK